MVEIYTYNAGKGECIRIRFAESHNVFVDTGVTGFAQEFERLCREVVSAGESLDALILTHVDDDHIGGILSNLRIRSYRCPFAEVWMNHQGGAVARDVDLSVRQNNEVYSRLTEQGVAVRAMKKGDVLSVAGAMFETFWPEMLLATNDRHGTDIPLSRHNDYRFSLSELSKQPISVRDTSQNNKNSIIFAFSYDDRRILFTGDAWADDVIKAAGRYDLIKLPHHGSVRNISEDYPQFIRSQDFLICTDGRVHPDKQTIAKLEKWYSSKECINIYSPTAWWKRGFFIDDDEDHNIKYYLKEGLVIRW